MKRRYLIRASVLAVAALALWFGLVGVVGPALIRQGYEGRSIGLVNRIMEGRATHPLQDYLADWNRLIPALTVAWVVAALLGYLLWRHRRRVLTGLARVFPTDMGEPLTRPEVVYLALCLGLIAGVIEAMGVFGKAWLGGIPNYGVSYSVEVIYMAPAANALLFVVCAALILGLTVRSRRRVSATSIVLIFTAATVVFVARSMRVGLHIGAVVVLALGIGLQASRWAAHRPRSLRFLLHWVPATLGACLGVTALALLYANRARYPKHPRSDHPPNILLIILDTVRRPNLSLYGHGRPTTPFLDRIAADAAVFDAAIAPSSWTLTSHASIFTGRFPHELGAGWYTRFTAAVPTVAAVLGVRGYRTAGFVANTFYAGARTGLDRGFQGYDDQPTGSALLLGNAWAVRSMVSLVTGRLPMPWGAWGRKHAEDVNASFLRWLDHTQDMPFFAFLNYFDAHFPYYVDPPFATRFSGLLPPVRKDWNNRYSRQELADFQLRYDNAIAYLDAQLDSLFRALERRDRLANTLVIVTSDHGEQFGEQRQELVGHGNSLYASTLQVPLIIFGPALGVPAARYDQPVTLRDLAATVMHIVDPRGPPELPGESLTGLWDPDGPGFAGTSPVLSEISRTRAMGALVPRWQRYSRSVTGARYHYIANGDGTEELYEPSSDPWERVNLVGKSQLIDVLESFRAQVRPGVSRPPTGTAPAP